MGDNKENKRLSEEKLTDRNVTESKDSGKQKNTELKEEKKKIAEEEILKAKEEIEKLLEQLQEHTGVSKDDVRVIKIRTPRKTWKAIALNALYSLILNTILIVSLSGYLVWAKNASVIQLVFFAFMYTGIELLFRNTLVLFYYKWIFKSMGLVLALPPFLAVLSSILLGSTFVEITSTSTILVMFMLLFVIRQMFNRIINNYRRG